MAATIVPVHPSGSTDGRPVKVGATATPGTLFHTAIAGTTAFDEIYLYLSNTSGSAVNVTVEWGGTTDPDDLICKTVSIPPNSGPLLVVPGLRLNNAKVVRVFASTTNVILASGNVNRHA